MTRSTRTCCWTCRSTGKTRPVLVHPGRDGFMFVIDRATGQIYSADKYDTQTSMLSLSTSRPAVR